MFTCSFVGSRFTREGQILRSGIITFQETIEVFNAPIGAWTENDYEKSWIDAIDRVVSANPSNSAIITGFNGFSSAFLNWWLLYPVKNEIFIQEQILMLEKLRDVISLQNLFDFIPPRLDLANDEKPSEWIETKNGFLMYRHCLMVARNEY